MLADVDPLRDVQLEQAMVGIEDIELTAAPLDAQRTAALLLVLKGQLLRRCLVGGDDGARGPVQ